MDSGQGSHPERAMADEHYSSSCVAGDEASQPSACFECFGWTGAGIDDMIWATCEGQIGIGRESFLLLDFSGRDGSQEQERHTVDRARAGDMQALGELYDSYFPRVYRYVLARTGSPPEAEDITEETFLRMLTGIGDFKWRQAPFAAWVFRIAHNQVITHARKNGNRRNHAPLTEGMTDAATNTLSQVVEDHLSCQEILEAAKLLPSAQRQVFWLRMAVGFSVRDTARALGKTDVNVKVLQHKAIARLQKLMAQPEPDEHCR
jgi:RNA polymerase sigma-70 factor (ECF subfamily)